LDNRRLRPAREQDAAAIRALVHEVGINPLGLDWPRFLLAVNDADQMIGCGQLKPHGHGIMELASLAVLPAWQSKGVGSMIIRHLVASAPRPLYLMCRPGLGPFYEKFGFQSLELQEMPSYFRRMARLVEIYRHIAHTEDSVLVMKLQ
jgi:N-acetylglutamate synthase-like GNAT family acetyltransferase